MGYLTSSKLDNIINHGICLPSTELRQGDWLILATVKVVTPMRLRYRFMNLNLLSCSVDPTLITSLNKTFGNLGLAYLVLRLDYQSGSPGVGGGLDVVTASALGLTRRPTSEVEFTSPGNYSWILANNMKASDDEASLISSSESIDFDVSVNGALRLELDRVA